MTCTQHLARMLAVTLPLQDILEQRVDDGVVPAWCETRGWSRFLLSLGDEAVRAAEAHGLATVLPNLAGAPLDLQALAKEVTAVTRLPRVAGSTPLDAEALRNVRLRKRAQLSSLLAAVAPMASVAGRIVDVGAGSGHFTRLSAELFQRQAVGLEHNPARVESAQKRAQQASCRATFVTVDARSALQFSPSDLAIGLHACGELGDSLVTAAARSGCELALVSCCLQKISTPKRTALSSAARGLDLRREHLGLTNLTAQPQGVEASIGVTIAARETRYALGQLLRARGIVLEPGAEMSGINRRQANAGLRTVAEKALALRELPPPTASELAHHEAAAARDYAFIRRLSLPRSMLSRLVEVLVSLDRATHLEEQGLEVEVATLFDRGVSPRNIGIFASRSRARLPRPSERPANL
ncbi:MAG TPA: methyltransferase [Polyangiaceae bacterium]|nr:methyltransferase [Polyangiaceae bacterium]